MSACRKRWFDAAHCMLDPHRGFDDAVKTAAALWPGRWNRVTGLECDGGAGHLGQVGDQEFHALLRCRRSSASLSTWTTTSPVTRSRATAATSSARRWSLLPCQWSFGSPIRRPSSVLENTRFTPVKSEEPLYLHPRSYRRRGS